MVRPPEENSSSDKINYPMDLMREVAADILTKAGLALDTHDKAWNDIRTYIHHSGATFSSWETNGNIVDVSSYLTNVLEPHAARLRASYEWQIKVATTLFDAVDAVEGAENAISKSFNPSGNPSDDTHDRNHRRRGFDV